MPFYHALVRTGLLDEDARVAFSNDVVDIHCGATVAPRSFVHVLFTEDDRGRLVDGVNGRVDGTIRAGRTDEQKASICDGISEALAARAGVELATVSTGTRDIEASFTMEGGELLP